jgi:hypothetical protein
MKSAYERVLQVKEGTAVQRINDILIEIDRFYGMEIKVEQTEVVRITRQPSSVQIMVHQTQLEVAEYFNNFCSLLTSGARWTSEIKSRIIMAKESFNKKKVLFTSKLDLNLRKKQAKYYFRSTSYYGAETCTIRKVDQNLIKF